MGLPLFERLMDQTGEQLVESAMQSEIYRDQLGPGSLGDHHIQGIAKREVRS
jgi:hypothetical protein